MSSLKSPRPTPQFFAEGQSLSTKKARATPREQPPPRPPVKSVPPISRIFNRPVIQRAQAVSFTGSESSFLSKLYNERSKDTYFDQCFQVESKIGEGSFGEVFKVKSKEDGKYFAVKRSRERFRGESDRLRKLEEVHKHEQLPFHINCITFHRAWEEGQHLYIQTELCDTSLGNYSELNHDIPEGTIWNLIIDLLQALKHLHDRDLIHLDIKPANIFISDDSVFKLGDFGLVVDLKKGNLSDAQEGDPKYLAPELMAGKFSKAADIFSLGITVLEVACDLDLPRGGDAWHDLRSGKIPKDFIGNLSVDLQKLIELMMHPDHLKRPTVNQILDMSLIKKKTRRRHYFLIRKMLVSRFQAALLCLWCFLTSIILSIWKFMKSKRLASSKRSFSEWDQSFSDDEVFEDEANLSHGSLATTLSDTSSSGESKNGSFTCTSRLVTSAPPFLRRHPKSTPQKSPSRNLDSFRVSPALSHSSFVQSSPVSNSSFHESKLWNPDDTARANIGPKNLMDVFEAESLDDSS